MAQTLEREKAKWLKKTRRESAIRDSKPWKELRVEFAALRRHETDAFGNVADYNLLRALGTYGQGCGEFGSWSVVGSAESIRERYAVLATQAAVALGAPVGVDLVGYFLHHMFSNLIGADGTYLSYATEEQGGMIRSLIEATLMSCDSFERIALENDHNLSTRRPKEGGSKTMANSDMPTAGDRTVRRLRALTMVNLPCLPANLQERFESQKAQAEFEFANGGKAFLQQPLVLVDTLAEILLIQAVFFAYCALAREAGRSGIWSLTQVRQGTEAAAIVLSEYYFVRKHAVATDEDILKFCNSFAEGVNLDPRGRKHQNELAEIANDRLVHKPVPTVTADEPIKPKLSDGEAKPVEGRVVFAVEAGNHPNGIAKRGPKKDLDTAAAVAAVISEIAPDGNWRSKLDDICSELDEKNVRCPKTWKKKRGHPGWFDCLACERHLVEKAITHHLKISRLAR